MYFLYYVLDKFYAMKYEYYDTGRIVMDRLMYKDSLLVLRI